MIIEELTVSELASLGYVTHADADTIELTSRGFDALQRQNYEAM
jgi:Mn-dependent DtxR family transcriptional regulator